MKKEGIFFGFPLYKGKKHCMACGKFVSGHVQIKGGFACNVNCALKVRENSDDEPIIILGDKR